MPGFITHLVFGENIIPFIDKKSTRSTIENHKTVFSLGLEGPDIFFYHIPAYLFYKHNIGNVMHSERVMAFFENLFISRNQFEAPTDLAICDAYICGFMGHYTLDVYCHPYIYYSTNHFENLKKYGSKYDFGQHVSFETDIDHEILMHYKKLLPNQFDYAAAIRPSDYEIEIVSSLLFSAINATYQDINMKKGTIKGAIKSIVNLNHAMHDPKGSKKRFLESIERKLFHCCFLSAMIPSDTIVKSNDSCNEEHRAWKNIWNEVYQSTDSIYDRFTKASPEYLKRIKLYMDCVDTVFSDDNIDEDKEIELETEGYIQKRNQLLAHLSDLSYLSGLPLD